MSRHQRYAMWIGAVAFVGAAACHDDLDVDPATGSATGQVDTRIDTITFEDVVPNTGMADTGIDSVVEGDGDISVDTETPLDSVEEDTALGADTAGDVVDSAVLGDSADADDAMDTVADTTPPATVNWGFECDGVGGEGCPCGDGSSCTLGLTCADTALGAVCVEPCVTTCAGDRRCARAAMGFSICLPAWEMLCMPCAADADCLEVGSACVDFGFSGRFCATRCADGSTGSEGCPDAFSCFALGAAGTRQCLPDAGDCACNDTGIALAASTECFADGVNACIGTRICEAEGLTMCDAQQPGEERCNGLDDNCNSMTDEGFDVGAACAAMTGGCANGLRVCTEDGLGTMCTGATSGTDEACNNIDDDCNGMTDEGCDDDADDYCDASMVLTASDACPLGGGDCNDEVPAISPGETVERCNNVDDTCDGTTDEGCDNDGDDYCDADLVLTVSDACPLGGDDCDDAANGVHPRQPELCDGVDNDCDGTTDGFSTPCNGACGPGTAVCTSGTPGACSGPAQLCSPGDPCCAASGCAYQPSTLQCKATTDSTERRCSGTCGGTVQKRDLFRRCTGDAASCGTGNRVWTGWRNEQGCGGSNLCSASGTSASCTSCAMGCTAGQCVTQPTHRICIDPGYGPASGPSSGGVAGHDVTWSAAQHLVNWLNADTNAPQGGGTWAITLTRTASSTPGATARRDICNAAGAARVISIGINGFNGSARGSETYHKTSAPASWITYATQVQAQVIAKGGLPDRGVKSTGSFTILTTTAPSVWTFLGFLDNSTDRASLSSNAWRREVARGLLHAIQQTMGYAPYTP